jgi:hypothetical protein
VGRRPGRRRREVRERRRQRNDVVQHRSVFTTNGSSRAIAGQSARVTYAAA